LVDNKIEINLAAVQKDYVGFKIMLDFCALIPFDYILIFFNLDKQVRMFFRVPRLFKCYRFKEIIEAMRVHSNVQIPLVTMWLLGFLFIIMSHYLACGYVFISRREIGMGRKYNKKTMYEDAIKRDFLDLPRFDTMSSWDEYSQNIYLASGTIGAVMYGDIIPYTMWEQLWTLLAMIICRLFLTLLFAEAAQYLSEIHSSYSAHVVKLNRITRWMRLNNFPKLLISRVVAYYDIIWNHFKGIDEHAILKDMPESMRCKIRF